MAAQGFAGRGKPQTPLRCPEPCTPITPGRDGRGVTLPGVGRLEAPRGGAGSVPPGPRSALAHEPAAGESAVVSSLAGEPSRGEARLVTSLSNFPTSLAPKIAKRKSRGPARRRPAWGEGPGRGTAARAGGRATPAAVTAMAEGGGVFGSPRAPCHRLCPVSGCWEQVPGLVPALGRQRDRMLGRLRGESPGCSTRAAGCGPAPSCPQNVFASTSLLREGEMSRRARL